MINFIHIGDYKTGTSWMQKYAFNLHPEIKYLGDPFNKKVDKEFNQLMYELVDSRDVDFNADTFRAKIVKKLNKISSLDKITGMSREAFSASNYITGEHARRNAERIKAVFRDVKIIFIIREQFSMLASIYSQYIKMGGTLTITDFILDSFECRGILERLKYHKTLAMYLEIFGSDKVHFDLFERFRKNKRHFLKDIYAFIGCRDADFFPSEDKTIVNISLTTVGVAFARFCNHFIRSYHHNRAAKFIPVDKMIAKILPKEKKVEMIKNTEQTIIPSYGKLDAKYRLCFAVNSLLLGRIKGLSEKIPFGQKIKVPAEIKKNLEDQFKESNTILLQRYNLPVDQYRWTL